MSSPSLSAGPYVGLVPYTESEAHFFFGREADRQTLIANLFASPLTILYGPSGVGKSSLLRAGVAFPLRQRTGQTVVVFDAWYANPLLALKQALTDEVRRVNANAETPSVQLPLDEFLELHTIGLHQPLFILLDQFEDFLLSHVSDDRATAFDIEFARALNREGLPVRFLIAVREDMLAKLDRFEERIPHLFDNYLRLEHLDAAGARLAITGPLAEYNKHLPLERAISIEESVITEIIRQVRPGQEMVSQRGRGALMLKSLQAQAERVDATYLQLVMKGLWDAEMKLGSRQLRLGTFTQLGGWQGIVHAHLDAILGRLSQDQQEIASYIFGHLVTPSGTKLALSARDLSDYAEIPRARVDRVVQRLAAREIRILRPVALPQLLSDEPHYELFQDALIAAVLDWRQRYLQRTTRPERIMRWAFVVIVALTLFSPSLSEPVLLAVLRGLSLLVLNVGVLLQLHQWFRGDIGLRATTIPLPGLRGQHMGILPGIVITFLWYVGTSWYSATDKANPLGTLEVVPYLQYLTTIAATVFVGFMLFWLMRTAGSISYRWIKNFDVGFYGVYFGVCMVLVLLILWLIAHPEAYFIRV